MLIQVRRNKMYLVIDIGGTFIKYALMSQAGSIIEKRKKRTPTTNLSEFTEMLFSIIEEHNVKELNGIASSCPGTIDVNKGTIYHGGLLPFLHEVHLVKIIKEQYGIEVTIENDAKCAALAELWLGSVKEANDSVVLVLGSGFGGGIIIDGKLHRGFHFLLEKLAML